MKFGGTSVADGNARAAVIRHVAARIEQGSRPVLVVSAMGRVGDPYATDTLLAQLGGPERDEREADMLMSCGEVISAVLLAHELRAAGIPGYAMTGAQAGVLTDDTFGSATVLLVDPGPISAALAEGLVPVVTGFQGVTAAGEVTTLGRGGSDTSACAIGAALKADAVEIFTDVDGVMTADPRACAGVRVLGALEHEELFQMARHGSRVMHAPAAETAMDAGVPVWIRNTFSAEGGTLVAEAERIAASRRARVATAVSHATGVARLRVDLPQDEAERPAAITATFRAMADAGCSLDMFTPLRNSLVFSLSEACLPRAREALDSLGRRYETEEGLAVVTLVGAGMHGVPGVMARVSEALQEAGVQILQVADSHTTISVLVPGKDMKSAIAALHGSFGLDEDLDADQS